VFFCDFVIFDRFICQKIKTTLVEMSTPTLVENTSETENSSTESEKRESEIVDENSAEKNDNSLIALDCNDDNSVSGDAVHSVWHGHGSEKNDHSPEINDSSFRLEKRRKLDHENQVDDSVSNNDESVPDLEWIDESQCDMVNIDTNDFGNILA